MTVRVGDRVTKGQEIGRVGNSGNTYEAHLHFQLMRSALPLSSDQVTWVIDDFTLAGTVTVEGIVAEPTAAHLTGTIIAGRNPPHRIGSPQVRCSPIGPFGPGISTIRGPPSGMGRARRGGRRS